jgi:hypothetical protein
MASPVASPTDLIELEDGEVVEGSVQDEIPTQPIYKGPLGARSLVDLSRGSEFQPISEQYMVQTPRKKKHRKLIPTISLSLELS